MMGRRADAIGDACVMTIPDRNPEIPIGVGDYCLRPMRADDRTALAEAGDNPKIAAGLRDQFPSPYTLAAADEFIASTGDQDPPRRLAIANAERLVGAIGIHPQDDIYRKSAELGYFVGEPWWGLGIGTAAVRAATDRAFARFDIVRVFASVFANNPASRRVLQKVGFTCEGCLRQSVYKSGQVLDQFLFAMLRDEWPSRE